jgi:TPR repeat protein
MDFFFTPETTKQSSRQSREQSARERSSNQSSPEPSKSGAWRTLLLLALLAALGVAGWWAYTNYLGVAESRKPDTAASSVGESSAEKPSMKPAAPTAAPAPTNDANSPQPVSPSVKIAGGQPEKARENASAAPNLARKTADRKLKPETKPATLPKIPMKTAPANQSAAKREPIVPAAKPSNPPATAADTGDAAFRKGEAYLYGRGVPENCDEAVKNLKAASAKSNARARSVLGTMYDTGHCVPRDLPTSYLWFALALRADPNNQILEKDLSVVWNQMTPPERQMATKMKQ